MFRNWGHPVPKLVLIIHHEERSMVVILLDHAEQTHQVPQRRFRRAFPVVPDRGSDQFFFLLLHLDQVFVDGTLDDEAGDVSFVDLTDAEDAAESWGGLVGVLPGV